MDSTTAQEHAGTPAQMHTYGAQPICGGFVKWGKSRDPHKRLQDQTMSFMPLVVVGIIPGDIESQLHAEYAEERTHLEWFVVSDRMKAEVKEKYGIDLKQNADSRVWQAVFRMNGALPEDLELSMDDAAELLSRAMSMGIVDDLLAEKKRRADERRRQEDEAWANDFAARAQGVYWRATEGSAHNMRGIVRIHRIDSMAFSTHANAIVRREYHALPPSVRALAKHRYDDTIKMLRRIRDRMPEHIAHDEHGEVIEAMTRPLPEFREWSKNKPPHMCPQPYHFPQWLWAYMRRMFPVSEYTMAARCEFLRNMLTTEHSVTSDHTVTIDEVASHLTTPSPLTRWPRDDGTWMVWMGEGERFEGSTYTEAVKAALQHVTAHGVAHPDYTEPTAWPNPT
jgi:hypothetical protein